MIKTHVQLLLIYALSIVLIGPLSGKEGVTSATDQRLVPVEIDGHEFWVNEPTNKAVENFIQTLPKRVLSDRFNFGRIKIGNEFHDIYNLPQELNQPSLRGRIVNELINNYSNIVAYYRAFDPAIAQLLERLLEKLEVFRSAGEDQIKLRTKYIDAPNLHWHADALARLLYNNRQSTPTVRIHPPMPFENPELLYEDFRRRYLSGQLNHLFRIKETPNLYTEILLYSTYTPPDFVLQMLLPDQRNDMEKIIQLRNKESQAHANLVRIERRMVEIIEELHARREFHANQMLSSIYTYAIPIPLQRNAVRVMEFQRVASNIDNFILRQIESYPYLKTEQLAIEIYLIASNTYLRQKTVDYLLNKINSIE